ncbi:GNAT family N-acetyltransferase [Exiguobacterium artemiae]|uniref:GNAT family N-acetyltransferase n=1 Tax=Exiguobacterium artemiae TaxID=340145 RepID=UPI0029655ADC|nr:GNAT family N-acetyltransferase [Exiguobacterium sibiricum]MDW2885799.1 GNAT family N-acetyltransferase [Exiguobacterium sibiricum]
MDVTIERVNDFDGYNWLPLLAKSSQEGFQLVERMLRNRREESFQEDGEAMFVALSTTNQVLACGGYMKQSGQALTGRIRHVYVLPEARSHGIGTALLEKIMSEAFLTYDRLVLYSEQADPFYQGLGFQLVSGEKITHTLDKTAFADSNR